MPINKSGQISETATWIIATLVIIIVLAISIFIASSLPKNIKSSFHPLDKKLDFVATKSITNFLIRQSNFELIENAVVNDDYSSLETSKLKTLIDGLPVNPQAYGVWNFELFVDGKKKSEIINQDTIGLFDYYETNFEFDKDSKKIKLKFWQDCQGGCQ